MKVFATFAIKNGEWKLIAGPDGDYQGQRKRVVEARAKGIEDGSDELRMVNLKASTVKRAVAHNVDRAEVKKARASYRESLQHGESSDLPKSETSKKKGKKK